MARKKRRNTSQRISLAIKGTTTTPDTQPDSVEPFRHSLDRVKRRLARVASGMGNLIVLIPDHSVYHNLPSTRASAQDRIRSHWNRVGESFQSAITRYTRETAKTKRSS